MLATGSLRKHPFLLALRRWGRFARRNVVSPRETSPAAKSEEKRMFSQARPREKQVDEPEAVKVVQSRFLHAIFYYTETLWNYYGMHYS